MDLILLRHTRVAAPPGTCYGQWDVPLWLPPEPSFADVARRLAALCAQLGPVQRLISSPLQRATELADSLALALGCRWAPDPRWMELNFGAWEGRPWHDIPRAQSDAWAADYHHLSPPGGETHAALVARVMAAAHDAVQGDPQRALSPAPGPCVVVTHAGPMRCLWAAAQGLPVHQQPELSLDFCGLMWLRAVATSDPASRQPQPPTRPAALRWTALAVNR